MILTIFGALTKTKYENTMLIIKLTLWNESYV